MMIKKPDFREKKKFFKKENDNKSNFKGKKEITLKKNEE